MTFSFQNILGYQLSLVQVFWSCWQVLPFTEWNKLKTYNCIVFTVFKHKKLYPFQNLSLGFILKIFLKFRKFQARYSYKIYSCGKKECSKLHFGGKRFWGSSQNNRDKSVAEKDHVSWAFWVNVTCFLAISPASLTESYSFWYGLKDLFTLYKLADKVVLVTIKTDDVTSAKRDVNPHRRLFGRFKGECVKTQFFPYHHRAGPRPRFSKGPITQLTNKSILLR